ncbi:MAG TPA: DUF6691 family protein [Burkholderiales bacterium]|nr:DUF6691 family protein [Burkholderiales bacterium]
MNLISAFLAGLLFGVGLIFAGMVNPAKVIAFLDVAGAWDPSLAFVMAGAIFVGYFGYRYAGGLSCSLLGEAMHLPGKRPLDTRLLAGSAVFGIGWGLGGLCPGPALVALTTAQPKIFVFVAAMLAGMFAYEGLRGLLGSARLAESAQK